MLTVPEIQSAIDTMRSNGTWRSCPGRFATLKENLKRAKVKAKEELDRTLILGVPPSSRRVLILGIDGGKVWGKFGVEDFAYTSLGTDEYTLTVSGHAASGEEARAIVGSLRKQRPSLFINH